MKRINGLQLAQHVGQEIIIIGQVTRVSPNGLGLEMQTTDGKTLNAALNDPVTDNLQGYVELHGVLQSKGTISCSNLIHFPEDFLTDFEPEQYNELISVGNLLGPKKWLLSGSDTSSV